MTKLQDFLNQYSNKGKVHNETITLCLVIFINPNAGFDIIPGSGGTLNRYATDLQKNILGDSLRGSWTLHHTERTKMFPTNSKEEIALVYPLGDKAKGLQILERARNYEGVDRAELIAKPRNGDFEIFTDYEYLI
jgi:hypothetical protein